jgi:hypothetical protein
MLKTSTGSKTIEWTCRVLLTFGLYVIVSGYLQYFQVKYQLDSPLIPADTVNMISLNYMKASLVISSGFLVCLWLYFFEKKLISAILLSISFVCFEIWTRFFP